MTIIIPVAVTIAYIFSPRFKEIQTQSGTKYQVKWIFMKKTFIIWIRKKSELKLFAEQKTSDWSKQNATVTAAW